MHTLQHWYTVLCSTVDIDECEEVTHDCGSDATCTNTAGGFNCTCNSGYEGDGIDCASKFTMPEVMFIIFFTGLL